MNKIEFEKVRRMLETYFPAAAKKKTDVYWHGLFEALSPFEYDAVKEQLLIYVRENKYFPDISDITAGLAEERPASTGSRAWMRPYVEALMAERNARLQEQSWI